MSFTRFLDETLAVLCVATATAGLVFTFEQSYRVSSLLWTVAYLFAICRLLLAARPGR